MKYSELQLGDHVKMTTTVRRPPFFCVPEGFMGVVTTLDDEVVGVTMDAHILGCDAWENELTWDAGHVAWTSDDFPLTPTGYIC